MKGLILSKLLSSTSMSELLEFLKSDVWFFGSNNPLQVVGLVFIGMFFACLVITLILITQRVLQAIRGECNDDWYAPFASSICVTIFFAFIGFGFNAWGGAIERKIESVEIGKTAESETSIVIESDIYDIDGNSYAIIDGTLYPISQEEPADE